VKNLMQSCCLSLFCILLLASGIHPLLFAEPAIDSLKVAYIYNIAKFTRWPAATWSTANAPFQLCYYGRSRVGNGLQSLQKKAVNGHPIKLFKPQSELDFKQCNALYINTGKRHRYRYQLSLVDPQKVLVISDASPFFNYGGLVNLVEKEQRLRFEVSMRQLARSKLKLSSKLLKLAILVDNTR